jgi:hypothetical protein
MVNGDDKMMEDMEDMEDMEHEGENEKIMSWQPLKKKS